MEDEIGKWEGKTTREAKSALAARAEAERIRGLKQQAGIYQGKNEKLTSADSAVDTAVRHIIGSNRDLSRMELASRANEIVDRILGSPDGRLSYDSEPTVGPPRFGGGQEVRGSLRNRDFAIPSATVKDFIEHDTQHLMSSYTRSILPDVMLTQRFGDIEMRDIFRKLNDEYSARAAGMKDEKSLVALEKERQGQIRDLAATRDRLRGVYGWTPDPLMRNAARVASVARNWNLISDLGTSVFNRLGDAGANAVFRHGFMNVMHDSWRPMFQAMTGNPRLAQAYRAQAKAMAVGVDGMLGHMAHDFGDAMENYRPGSKFERGLSWAAISRCGRPARPMDRLDEDDGVWRRRVRTPESRATRSHGRGAGTRYRETCGRWHRPAGMRQKRLAQLRQRRRSADRGRPGPEHARLEGYRR